jgi:predicted short-subunit dehydrogenase-like oxidoreductase (DUF2520 family)
MKRINIIGCGRAAVSLARLWREASTVQIGGVLNRSEASSQKAVMAVGAGQSLSDYEQFEPADYWMIGTSDDQIEHAAQALSRSRLDLTGSTVFHLCGRHGVNILAPLSEKNCHIAAVHPVRSLTLKKLTLDDFAGTACVAESDRESRQGLQALFESIGGVWMPVVDMDRGLYHAAVSIISNITKAVSWKAQKWLMKSGLDEHMASDVTSKLLHSTLDDVSRSGARQSITGPVVRGDTSTIEAHISALRNEQPDDVEVYQVLARTVLELARERGDLDGAVLRRFEDLLDRDGANSTASVQPDVRDK